MKTNQPPRLYRAAAFFTADVSEAVDYVLDQAGAYRDQHAFVSAVIDKLKTWNKADEP